MSTPEHECSNTRPMTWDDKNAEIDRLTSSVSVVERRAVAAEAEVARLKAELAGCYAEIDRLKNKLTSCKPVWTVTASASDSLDTLSARLDALNKRIDSAMVSGHMTISGIEDRLAKLETRLDDACRVAATNREKVQSRLAALEADKYSSRLAGRIAALEAAHTKAAVAESDAILRAMEFEPKPVEAGVVQALKANRCSIVSICVDGAVGLYAEGGIFLYGTTLADCIAQLRARRAEEKNDVAQG